MLEEEDGWMDGSLNGLTLRAPNGANNTISAMGGANYLSYSKVLLHTANTRGAQLHISSVVLMKR